MKSVIAIIAVFFTVAATAGIGQDSSFKDLRKARSLGKVWFELPQYQLKHGHFVWADKACLNGNTIESKNNPTIKKCVRWGSDGDETVCEEYKVVSTGIAVSGTRYGCLEWGYTDSDSFTCLRYGQKPYSYNTSFVVKVYKNSGMNNDNVMDPNNRGRLLFEKDLVVPSCN